MKKEIQLPRIIKGLVLEEVGEDLLVYDNSTARAHLLNATCARALRLCLSGASLAEAVSCLGTERGIDPESARLLLTQAVQELRGAGLAEPEFKGSSRRKFLKAAGLGLALTPTLSTILTPTPVDAASIITPGTCANVKPGNNERLCPLNTCTTGGTCQFERFNQCKCK